MDYGFPARAAPPRPLPPGVTQSWPAGANPAEPPSVSIPARLCAGRASRAPRGRTARRGGQP